MSKQDEWIRKADFRQGFLFALGEKRERINIRSTQELHRAFGNTIALAVKTLPAESARFEFLCEIQADPIFGFYPYLNELLLEGEADLLVEFGRNAIYLQVEKDEAKEELNKRPQADWFRRLADHFIQEMEKPPETKV